MRILAALALAVATLVPATSAAAHTQDTDKPVILLAAPGGPDCGALFGALKARLAEQPIRVGKEDKTFRVPVTLAPGAKGGCDEGLDADPAGGADAVADKLAGYLASRHAGQPVDVVAVGESGVALRIALSRQGREGRPALAVEDAVTVGSPHSSRTEPELSHPIGRGGTDWSVIAAAGDGAMLPDAALAMDADHKTLYRDRSVTTLKLLNDARTERTARIAYQHASNDMVNWNKAPHGIERIALDLVYGVDSCTEDSVGAGQAANCGTDCRQTVAKWRIEFTCPEGPLEDGTTIKSVESPSGVAVTIPRLDYRLPVASARRLRLPLILPDVRLSRGGVAISMVENTLDDDGITVGYGSFSVERFGIDAEVEGLVIGTDNTLRAEAFGIEALGGALEATKVKITGAGVTAATATLTLPPALGGSNVTVSGLVIDRNGVHGTVTGGSVRAGELTLDIKGARFDQNGFDVETAKLELPKYLGSAKLDVTGLKWDGKDLTFRSAHGEVDFSLGGGRLRVAGAIDLQLFDGGGYAASGSVRVVVGDARDPLFAAAATLSAQSVDCPTKPGPCRNGAYLKEATISVELARAIPLGTTGIALKGLSGGVESDGRNAKRDKDGSIVGVVYTFSLGATLVSYPNQAVFQAPIAGSVSTNGNFGLGIPKPQKARAFGFVDLEGGFCVLFSEADTVCKNYIGAKVSGPGAFVEATVGAGVSYLGGKYSASISGSIFGRFRLVRGEPFIDATLKGSINVNGSGGYFLPDVSGRASLTAQFGRFAKDGQSVLGMTGSVAGSLNVGGTTATLNRSIFIDANGKYTETGVEEYELAGNLAAAAQAGAGQVAAFELGKRQTQTTIVLEAESGTPSLELTTPGGQRASIEAPGVVRPLGSRNRRELDNVLAVRTEAPHTVMVFLPKAQPGRWTARVRGAAPGTYRLDVRANKPQPRLTVRAQRGKGRNVLVAGTLRGAAGRARVALYAGPGGCAARGGAQPLATVPVRRGAWRYRWKPGSAPAGRYTIHAQLANGTGPLVTACTKRGVVVKARRPVRKPEPKRRARARVAAAPHRSPAPAASPVVARAAQKKQKSSQPPRTCGPMKNPTKGPPTMFVEQSTLHDIAINDAAALTGRESGGAAVTYFRNKKRVIEKEEYPARPSLAELHWSLYAPPYCASSSKKNRREACGGRLFAKNSGGKTSCDEFPFASTTEGGLGAIVRGVKKSHNDVQGDEIAKFYRDNAVALAQNGGLFYVCVKLDTGSHGRC